MAGPLSVAGLECLRERTMLAARRVYRLQVQVWTVTEGSQQLESRFKKALRRSAEQKPFGPVD